MVRFRSLLLLVIAIFGLAAPSLASAFDGLVVDGAIPVAAEIGAVVAHQLTPCELQGGKRVLPCHPDQGVTAPGGELAVVAPSIAWHRRSDALPEGSSPEAFGPPPRRA